MRTQGITPPLRYLRSGVTWLPLLLPMVYAIFGSVYLIVRWRYDDFAPLLLAIFTFPAGIFLLKLLDLLIGTLFHLGPGLGLDLVIGIYATTFLVLICGGALWYYGIGVFLRFLINRAFFRNH
jgi:hypothetical protein